MAIIRILWLIIAASFSTHVVADSIRIAVAANFKPVLEKLALNFTSETGIDAQISSGSTGALYAQIVHGAPFDIFLAADSERPLRLESEGRITPASRASYALGRLAFWVPSFDSVSEPDVSRVNFPIAMANPKLAPYGRAAVQVLDHVGRDQTDLILGSNIAQTFAFVATGNARAGFVALSQVTMTNVPLNTFWLVPSSHHATIEQQLVVLRDAHPGSKQFVEFLHSKSARDLIRSSGFDLPDKRDAP